MRQQRGLIGRSYERALLYYSPPCSTWRRFIHTGTGLGGGLLNNLLPGRFLVHSRFLLFSISALCLGRRSRKSPRCKRHTHSMAPGWLLALLLLAAGASAAVLDLEKGCVPRRGNGTTGFFCELPSAETTFLPSNSLLPSSILIQGSDGSGILSLAQFGSQPVAGSGR